MPDNSLAALYQEIILEHSRKPRNFGALACPPAIEGLGHNPSCGDKLVLFVQLEGDIIKDIKHNSEGCAIFSASCSLLSAHLIGKSKPEVLEILDIYLKLITLSDSVPSDAELTKLGKLGVFQNIRQYPARIKCAALFTRTLQSLLLGESAPASTEDN